MTERAKSNWGWIAVTVGLLTIGGKVVDTTAFVQDLASRVLGLEKGRAEDKQDLKYIRERVDEIRDRLPPKEK